jgi:hypothetical protein
MPTIRGRVLDEAGTPVAQAAVYVISAPGPHADIAQVTGADGAFEVEAGPPGSYVIGARSDTAGEGRAEVAVASGDASVTITLAPA